jgi:beta-glucosidase
MCSYNRVNGEFACENKYLLTDLLKKEWKFPGFVVSDWGGTHSTEKASAAGLDNEQPGSFFFSDKYKAAVEAGKIPVAELDEHVHRILRAMFDAGVIDHPRQRSVIDPFAGFETARKIEEGGIVLLKKEKAILPLNAARLHAVAIVGSCSDVGRSPAAARLGRSDRQRLISPGQARTGWKSLVPHLAAQNNQARAPRRP